MRLGSGAQTYGVVLYPAVGAVQIGERLTVFGRDMFDFAEEDYVASLLFGSDNVASENGGAVDTGCKALKMRQRNFGEPIRICAIEFTGKGARDILSFLWQDVERENVVAFDQTGNPAVAAQAYQYGRGIG